jgi:8-amino-7-oxononanoate synthase
VSFDAHVRDALAQLQAAGLLRTPRELTSPQGPEAQIQGRLVSVFCSNDYLGLATHPALRNAACQSLSTAPYGSGASRHVSGSSPLHSRAEAALADFVGFPASVLFATGYAANVGAVQALVGPGDVVFSDELNHASLIDGCRLSRARVHVYPHRNLGALEQLLHVQRSSGRAALVLTDAVFSMDGTLAPVAELRALCDRFGAGLLVDEAHALGVLGPQGRGLCAALGVRPDVLVGMLGKAFGAAGAFVAGPADTARLVQNRARSFVFSTAPPPSQAAAALAALELVRTGDALREQLSQHAVTLRDGLTALGYQLGPHASHILPVLIGEPEATMRLSAALLERGVFVHGIRPPTVPSGSSRLRLTPMASHTALHVQQALDAFAALRP